MTFINVKECSMGLVVKENCFKKNAVNVFLCEHIHLTGYLVVNRKKIHIVTD